MELRNAFKSGINFSAIDHELEGLVSGDYQLVIFGIEGNVLN